MECRATRPAAHTATIPMPVLPGLIGRPLTEATETMWGSPLHASLEVEEELHCGFTFVGVIALRKIQLDEHPLLRLKPAIDVRGAPRSFSSRRPAATRRASVSATSAPTSTARRRRWRGAPDTPRSPSRSAGTSSVRDICRAGTRPISTPVCYGHDRREREDPSCSSRARSAATMPQASLVRSKSIVQTASSRPSALSRQREQQRFRDEQAERCAIVSRRARCEARSRACVRRPWPAAGSSGSRRQ